MAGIKGRSGGKREGAGRSAFKPTEEQRELVRQLTAFGLRVEDMVLFIKGTNGKSITANTLTKHFRDELSKGKLRANVAIAQTLFKKAKSGDNTCMIFWLRTQAGWKDAPQRFEHSGPEGLPIATTAVSMEEFRKAVRDVKDDY